jgi:predicted short-subunit dehydrogenase-like oxidoreductase (DUF2520 family)
MVTEATTPKLVAPKVRRMIPGISIIGPGKVGTALGVLAVRGGLRVVAVGGRDAGKVEAAAKAIGPGVKACGIEEAARAGGLVLLTVPDDAIQAVCKGLAGAGAFRRGAIAAHCSGAMGSEVLVAAKEKCGCHVGSMHPLQTFPTVEAAVAKLPGTYFFCEGDEVAANALEGLASAIGGRPVRITPQAKPLYHAAAVMACNYLTALMDAAMELAGEAGIDRATAMAALEPLVRSTVDNVFSLGTQEALTGPIARGDVQTVQRHLMAMPANRKALRMIYLTLGAWAAEMARKKGTLSISKATETLAVLAGTHLDEVTQKKRRRRMRRRR